MATTGRLSPEQLKAAANAVIIDVRTVPEHQEIRLQRKHHHIPLDQLDPASFMRQQELEKDQPVCLLCRSGKRAQMAAENFVRAGFTNVHVIDGGILSCEAAGLPVSKSKVVSLERQVRITAGLLVMAGIILGYAMNPLFYVLSAFVGAGLVFAGITDRCGMALMLAKAPWNESKTANASCGIPTEGAVTLRPEGGTCAGGPAALSQKSEQILTFFSPANGSSASVPKTESFAACATSPGKGGCS